MADHLQNSLKLLTRYRTPFIDYLYFRLCIIIIVFFHVCTTKSTVCSQRTSVVKGSSSISVGWLKRAVCWFACCWGTCILWCGTSVLRQLSLFLPLPPLAILEHNTHIKMYCLLNINQLYLYDQKVCSKTTIKTKDFDE